jgi:adenine-specific DNA-methyltransferase
MLGAFYTPPGLAHMLAEWLIRTGCERILEPSVGEGALVDAAFQRSRALTGISNIRVLACDINPDVIETITSRFAAESECDARTIDFLQLDPASTGLFTGVLTNPPFIRNHSIDARERASLRQRFAPTGAAGLWVHFLLHGLNFLAPGGRLAAVIPASGLFSDYGLAALDRMCRRFARVEVRQIVDKPQWGNAADERGALLLADGFGQGTCALPRGTLWSVKGHKVDEIAGADAIFDQLMRHTTPLGSLATLSIGAVTGCNRIFLMTEEDRRTMGINRADVRPVVSRARHLRGLSIDATSLFEQASAGEKTWLLTPQSIDAKGQGVRRQLARIPAKQRRFTHWFAKRKPWWKVSVPNCDAIFTYMNDRGPRLVLASDEVGCTNTLHCVRFASDVSPQARMAASLTFLSTFGQLAAERIGRSYGGGVLKFELKDARRLPTIPPKSAVEDCFAKADQALRQGDHVGAIKLADEMLVAPLLGRNWRSQVAAMNGELNCRRRIRWGS